MLFAIGKSDFLTDSKTRIRVGRQFTLNHIIVLCRMVLLTTLCFLKGNIQKTRIKLHLKVNLSTFIGLYLLTKIGKFNLTIQVHYLN